MSPKSNNLHVSKRKEDTERHAWGEVHANVKAEFVVMVPKANESLESPEV